MRPTQHISNTAVLRPPPGTTAEECSGLPVTQVVLAGDVPAMFSYWLPTDEERRLIASGRPIRLSVLGLMHPPVALGVDGDGLA